MELLGATIFLTLAPKLWAGVSVKIGNNDFDIESKISNRIELFNPQVAGFSPDRVNYNLKLGYNINKNYRVEFEENCLHGVSELSDSNIVNSHSIKFTRKNLKDAYSR